MRLGIRHFPVTSAHSRAFELACASEAAALQGRFWEMLGSILGDQSRIDDPHLWQRARDFGLDLDRFEADRRSESTAERVRSEFRSAIRAGVSSTPSFLVAGRILAGVPDAETVEGWCA